MRFSGFLFALSALLPNIAAAGGPAACQGIQSASVRLDCHDQARGASATCKAISSDEERLACYEQDFPKLSPLEALRRDRGSSSANASGRLPRSDQGWRLTSRKSAFTDQRDYFLTQESNLSVTCGFARESQRLTLHIRCMEDTTAVFISSHCHLASGHGGYGRVDLRVDSGAAFHRNMDASTSNDSLGLWRGRQAIPLIRNHLLGGSELTVRFTPFGENPLTAKFNLRDLDKMIAPLRASCGW